MKDNISNIFNFVSKLSISYYYFNCLSENLNNDKAQICFYIAHFINNNNTIKND
jgi:hypothetical protein